MHLEAITRTDKDYLYKLQSIVGIRDYALNPSYPSIEEHNNWFETKIKDDSTKIYKIILDGSPVGVIRSDKIIEDKQSTDIDIKVEISLTIDPAYSGKGIAKKAIAQIISEVEAKIYTAVIRSDNIASVKAFIHNGFEYKKPFQDQFNVYQLSKD